MKEFVQVLREIAVELFPDRTFAEITNDSNFADDIDLDSLGYISVLVKLGEEYGFEIDDLDLDALAEVETVRQLRELVMKQGCSV